MAATASATCSRADGEHNAGLAVGHRDVEQFPWVDDIDDLERASGGDDACIRNSGIGQGQSSRVLAARVQRLGRQGGRPHSGWGCGTRDKPKALPSFTPATVSADDRGCR